MSPARETAPQASPCTMVVFGASGDLARRKLFPALYELEKAGLLPSDLSIVGFARSSLDTAALRAAVRAAVEASGRGAVDPAALERLTGRLRYLRGSYSDPASFAELGRLLQSGAAGSGRLYYLALPPEAAEQVLRQMASPDFSPACPEGAGCRLMIEKPFGHDRESARRLNELCRSAFGEERIYRVDHYLAKDTVRNLLVLRFTNAVFAHIWNRDHIDSVQITAAETAGVGHRGGYYDSAGVVRDMIQNHLFQVLSLVAMEPPVAGDPESVRDRKAEVFRSLRPLAPGDFVLGQYRGYRDEPEVARGSTTPTFAALRLRLDNWRWEGVPFYLRSGKRMAAGVGEVVIGFRSVPACVLDDPTGCAMLRPNRLVIRLQPEEGLRLSFCTRVPGHGMEIREADLDFRYAGLGAPVGEAYEQVLLDGLAGRGSYFLRSDGIEAAWSAVAPMLAPPAPGGLHEYEPGSWGPPAAAALPAADGRSWLAGY